MKYIYGFHDPGGEHLMADKPGWLTITEAIGASPHDHSGVDYRLYAPHGVIVRLNNGYKPGGTIPLAQHYEAFAQRCASFVAASPGCTRWIIGNEPNHEQERPEGQEILPEQYAECFLECRQAIKLVQPQAEVLVAGIAPWNGDWLAYYKRMLTAIGGECDGYILHGYTHGDDPNLPFSDEKVHGWYWHLNTILDQLAQIPASGRSKPCYGTESNQGDHAWTNRNVGYVQNVYRRIHEHNQTSGTQKILCWCLYRWLPHDKYSIRDKAAVIEDFKTALQANYLSPAVQPASSTTHIPAVSTAPALAPVREIDPRLPTRGVSVKEISVPAGQSYYRITRARWLDEQQSQGRHHIYAEVLDENGQRVVGEELEVLWPGGSHTIKTEAKPGEEFSANFPMSASRNEFSIRIKNGPTETLSGIGMGADTPSGFNAGIHTSTAVTFQKVRAATKPPPIVVTPPPAAKVPKLLHPIENPALRILTQKFGEHPEHYLRFGHKGHAGLDFGVPVGTPVRAADSGTAVEVGNWPESLGLYVKLYHAWKGDTVYAHLSRQDVQLGQQVQRGQTLGLSGNTGNSTGPHLHFALRPVSTVRNGDFDGFADPLPYLTDDDTFVSIEELLPLVKRAAHEADIDWQLLVAVVEAESRFDVKAKGADGEYGLCQILPSTWTEWVIKSGLPANTDPYDPYSNLRVGAFYLAWLVDGLDSEEIALVANNFGIGNVLAGRTPPLQTTLYATKIKFAADLLRKL